jgi:hypothetical protein
MYLKMRRGRWGTSGHGARNEKFFMSKKIPNTCYKIALYILKNQTCTIVWSKKKLSCELSIEGSQF